MRLKPWVWQDNSVGEFKQFTAYLNNIPIGINIHLAPKVMMSDDWTIPGLPQWIVNDIKCFDTLEEAKEWCYQNKLDELKFYLEDEL